MNKTADTLPKFHRDYIFIRTVAESKTQPCITFVETRSGVVISFMCARKGDYEDLTKEILRHFEAYSFLNPVIVPCDKEMSIIDVCRKLHANETQEQCYDFRQKQVTRATGLSKQYMDSYRDSHDATRHKLRRTLVYNFQQFHLPFHFAIRYAGFVLSRFAVRLDGRTPFQYLLDETPYVSLLCMFGELIFALIPDHEVRAAKLTNRWISGCWWERDASSDEHLVGTKHRFAQVQISSQKTFCGAMEST